MTLGRRGKPVAALLACSFISVCAQQPTAMTDCQADANFSLSFIQTGSVLKPELRNQRDIKPQERQHTDLRTTVLCHIGKTGGTSFQAIVKKLLDPEKATFANGHQGAYDHLHACQQQLSEKFVFFVRAPVHRFISGWISRYRMGGTAYFEPWLPYELLAFWRFHSPNDLAEALSSSNADRQAAAKLAMKSIIHVKWSVTDYWGGLDNFAKCAKSPFFVGRFEFLGEDYVHLLRQMSFYGELISESEPFPELPENHETPAKYDGWRYLSSTAIENLQIWYQDDYVLASELEKLGYLPNNYSSYIMEYDKHHGVQIGVNLWTFRTPYILAFAACLILLGITGLVYMGNRVALRKESNVQSACQVVAFCLVLAMLALLVPIFETD